MIGAGIAEGLTRGKNIQTARVEHTEDQELEVVMDNGNRLMYVYPSLNVGTVVPSELDFGVQIGASGLQAQT